ncbi:MAG: hypothetical protein IJ418_07485 [Clostridia bacterium]|nr:hypothetical protein [Clostridia bacterium]
MNNNGLPELERWLKTNDMDSRLEYYAKTYEKWRMGIPDDIWPIVEQMIDQFEYYGHRRVNSGLCALNGQLKDAIGDNVKYALFTYINDIKGKINSSNEYWFEYRTINGISSKNCTDNISLFPKDVFECIENIIIVDDCCGTGNSLKTFIENCKVDFSGKTLYYLVIHAMEESYLLLNQVAEEYGMSIKLISLNSSPKFFDVPRKKEKELFVQRMKKLGLDKKPLGFDDSEALIAFSNNTPNNTFPLFHKETEKNCPVFPRKEKSDHPWRELKKQKENRKKQNYLAVIKEKNDG